MCVVSPRFGLEVNGKLYAPSSLTPVEEHSVAHCIGACMSPRNDLYTLANNNMFSCARIRPIIPFFFLVHCVPNSLYRQSYPSYRVGFILRNMFEILFFQYVFCVVFPRRLVETCHRFGETCSLDFQSSFSVLQNCGKFLPDYTVLQPTRQHPSSHRLLTQSV